MGYIDTSHRYVHTVDLTFAASAARTTTADGAAIGAREGANAAAVTLDVTAASGTSPTLAVKIQGQTSAGAWYDLHTFTTATGISAQTAHVDLSGRSIRATWTIGGTTPSFTFSVIGEGS